MRRFISTTRFLATVVAGCLIGAAITLAGKPDKPGGGGGGGGGNDPAPYLIIELPSLIPNEGVLTESISDVSADGTVFVVGKANGSRACLWTIDANLEVVAEDLGDWLYDNWLDVNSAGVVAGSRPDDLSPVLLMPDRQLIDLPGATDGRVRINNSDEFGVFQVVGSDVLWDVSVDGTILATTLLEDSQGTPLYATDINDSEQIAGFVIDNNVAIPAVGEFDEGGELVITTLVNPDPSIAGFRDMQIDHAGNVLGDGWEEPTDPDILGDFPRGVIWLAAGGVIDLGAELDTFYASGEGIASVNGTMQCVGAYYNREIKAYVYSSGTVFDLQDLDSPWFEIDHAGDINSSGIICARGKAGKRRDYQLLGCLLIPMQP